MQQWFDVQGKRLIKYWKLMASFAYQQQPQDQWSLFTASASRGKAVSLKGDSREFYAMHYNCLTHVICEFLGFPLIVGGGNFLRSMGWTLVTTNKNIALDIRMILGIVRSKT